MLILNKQGELHILDYKSDRDDYLTEEEFEQSLKEKYNGQLQMYKKAMARLFGLKEDVISLGLLSLTEKVTSILTLKIKEKEETVKEQVFPISFMAYNQWHGVECYPQLLASFITPNHPCIASIIKRASEHLNRLSGSSDFTGYMYGNTNEVRM